MLDFETGYQLVKGIRAQPMACEAIEEGAVGGV